MAKRIPYKRLAVFAFLCEYKRDHDGCPPTYAEISEAFGWGSAQTAWLHVQGLERDKRIEFDRNRKIRIIGGEYIPPGECF